MLEKGLGDSCPLVLLSEPAVAWAQSCGFCIGSEQFLKELLED